MHCSIPKKKRCKISELKLGNRFFFGGVRNTRVKPFVRQKIRYYAIDIAGNPSVRKEDLETVVEKFTPQS
jgi:hypothetical protein